MHFSLTKSRIDQEGSVNAKTLFKLLFNISSLLFNRRVIETKNNNTFLSNLEVCYKIAFTILNTLLIFSGPNRSYKDFQKQKRNSRAVDCNNKEDYSNFQ